MVIVTEKYAKWSFVNQLLMISTIFLLFHIPNTLLRFEGVTVVSQLFLLFFFGLGQALLFARYRNLYALALSQAIWGMVIVIYTR
jgi:membrane protease YdiL (CAAX protease family)